MVVEAVSQHKPGNANEKKLLRDSEEQRTEIATVRPEEALHRHDSEKSDKTYIFEHNRHGRAKSWLPIALVSFLFVLLFAWDHLAVSWLVAHSTVLHYVPKTLHPNLSYHCIPGTGDLNEPSPSPNITCMLLRLCLLIRSSLNCNSGTFHIQAASTPLYQTSRMDQ